MRLFITEGVNNSSSQFGELVKKWKDLVEEEKAKYLKLKFADQEAEDLVRQDEAAYRVFVEQVDFSAVQMMHKKQLNVE